MADLQFVDFPLIPGPVRKEMQFKQPCDFSKIDVTTLSGMSHSVSGFQVQVSSLLSLPLSYLQ